MSTSYQAVLTQLKAQTLHPSPRLLHRTRKAIVWYTDQTTQDTGRPHQTLLCLPGEKDFTLTIEFACILNAAILVGKADYDTESTVCVVSMVLYMQY